MGWLQIFRLTALSIATVCGVIVASMSAHLTAFAIENFAVYYVFAILGLVVGALTLLTVPAMLIIDFLRTGAFTSMVVVELSWLSILWVLWIAAGALTANDTSAVFATCEFIYPILNQVCHESRAIEGFSFVAWIALFAYTLTLFIVALINASRGVPIWKSTVREHGAVVPAPQSSAPTQAQGPTQPQMGYDPNAQSQQFQRQSYIQQHPYATGQPHVQQYQAQPIYAMPNPSVPQQPQPQVYTPPSQGQYVPQPAGTPASNGTYNTPSNFSSHPQV